MKKNSKQSFGNNEISTTRHHVGVQHFSDGLESRLDCAEAMAGPVDDPEEAEKELLAT